MTTRRTASLKVRLTPAFYQLVKDYASLTDRTITKVVLVAIAQHINHYLPKQRAINNRQRAIIRAIEKVIAGQTTYVSPPPHRTKAQTTPDQVI